MAEEPIEGDFRISPWFESSSNSAFVIRLVEESFVATSLGKRGPCFWSRSFIVWEFSGIISLEFGCAFIDCDWIYILE